MTHMHEINRRFYRIRTTHHEKIIKTTAMLNVEDSRKHGPAGALKIGFQQHSFVSVCVHAMCPEEGCYRKRITAAIAWSRHCTRKGRTV